MSKKMEKKYIPLSEFFQNSMQNEMTLTYTEIENIMGQELPNAAYLNLSWWKKTKPPLTHFLTWTAADFNVIDVKLGHSITFSKLTPTENTGQANNKNTYIIRSIETDDARSFINLQEEIFAETTFNYFEPNEQALSVQKVRKLMAEWRKQKNATIQLCIFNGLFAGYSILQGNTASKTKHISTIQIAVKQDFANKGVGTALLNDAEKWAKENEIERLEASIMLTNQRALSLFEKQGYNNEGTRIKAVKVNDAYVDELYFSKFI